jgi:hypothetical protein
MRNQNLFLKYCMDIAKEFDSRLNRIRTFVPDHNLISGTSNEAILRDFLASHVPGTMHVGQGFVCNPLQEISVSRQVDILVHDSQFPYVYVDGPVKIVWPKSAHLAIEVKTKLNKDEFLKSVNNIASIRGLYDQIRGVVFAFRSVKEKTVINYMTRVSTKGR